MNPPAHSSAQANPFSTRFIRPGAIPYIAGNEDAASVLARLERAGWRGQIIGAHGSGKSTLLASLIPRVEQAGRRPIVFSLHDGQRKMPRGWRREARRASAPVVIIDGYEQLSPWQRAWVKIVCRGRRWGLLVTAHADAGLPLVCRTDPSLPIAQEIVERLLPPGDRSINREMVAESFAAARGNMREMLFSLYDRYERRDDE